MCFKYTVLPFVGGHREDTRKCTIIINSKFTLILPQYTLLIELLKQHKNKASFDLPILLQKSINWKCKPLICWVKNKCIIHCLGNGCFTPTDCYFDSFRGKGYRKLKKANKKESEFKRFNKIIILQFDAQNIRKSILWLFGSNKSLSNFVI